MKMKHLAKQSLCFLLSAGMVLNSGLVFNPPVYAATETNVHEITVDGDVIDSVNTFKGFGAVTCNNTSRLLMDYKEEHPDKYWEMMELLFNPEKGAGLNHIKVEMGGDVNSSSGTEPATMRSPEEEANVLRGAGWHFAADAKTINPDITVEILRWGEPKWTQEGIGYEAYENPKYEARYQWYKKTIDAVYDEYGYEVNYVSPGQNERRRDYGDNTEWIKYCGSRLNEDAAKEGARYDYSQIQIVAADTHSNSSDIAGRMLSDSELMDIVDVVSDHYTLYGNANLTEVNQEYGKEVWYSEAIAPMINAKYRINVDPDRGGVGGKVGMADLATRFINSYSYAGAGENQPHMTRFEFQPAIGAFYEGSAYSPKQLIGAFDPWSGYYDADGGLQMVGHFMEFADLGWNYLPDACYGDGTYSDGGVLADTGTNNYLTLKDPETDDYSMIFANNTSQTRKYKVKVENLKKASSPLNVWETRGPDEGEEYDANWMQMVDSFTPNKESYGVYSFTLTVKPYSIMTVTSLLDRGKEYEPGQNDSEVERSVLELPYTDDFEYAGYETDEEGRTYLERRGGTPRYTTDQYGAFEVQEGSFGNHVLTQVINDNNRPYDWNVWGNGTDENSQTSGRPRTVLGDHRWTNYVAGIDFKLDTASPECFENYAGIGVREVVHEGTSANDISTYTFQVFKDGTYKLSSRSGQTENGTLENFDSTAWHNMQLSADENVLTAYVDGKKAAELVDKNQTSMSGRVTLTSGFHNTQFDNLEILPIEGKAAAAEQKLDDTSELITWDGNWTHVLNEGYGHYNRTRTYGGAIEKGVYAHDSGQVRYYKGGNPLAWGSNDSNAWGSAGDEAHYEFDFYGTGIEIYGEANSNNGTGQVYIDGEPVGTVNYNSSNGGTGHDVFNLELDPTQIHTLKVVATSSFISLRKLKVIGEPDDGSDSRENSFSLTFDGTGINVFGNSGAATLKVEVDGEIREAACETPAAGNRQTTYSLQKLPEGTHTVKITVEGGTYYVDGIDVIGTAAEGVTVSTAKLQALIDAARKLTNEDETYLTEDWENFQKAIISAEAAVAEGSQEALNQAYLALRNAMEKLGKAGTITEVTGLPLAAAKDKLPEMLTLKVNGEVKDVAVTWELESGDWNLLGSTVKLKGVLEGLDAGTISWSPIVYSSSQVYFIDCGIGVGKDNQDKTSEIYQTVKAGAENLKNETADQEGKDKSWGIGSDYAGMKGYVEGHGLHATGYYGNNTVGDSFTYKVTLDAGEYNITTGHTEWWSGNSRSTKVTASYVKEDGTIVKTELGNSGSTGGTQWKKLYVQGHLSVPEDGTEVTLTFTATEAKGAAVSYIAIEVPVTELTVNKIKVDVMPNKTVYELGGEFEPTGMVVSGYHGSEFVRELTEDEYTIEGPDMDKAGQAKVVVTYESEEGKVYSAFFRIAVYDPEDLRAESIKIVKEPEKTVYLPGESFDADGMDVRLLLKATASNAIPTKAIKLEDGEYDVISDLSEPGRSKVEVCYTYLDENGEEKELKDTIKVTVLDENDEFYQKGINIVKQPKRSVYAVGEPFDPTGMVVEAVMKASTSNASYAEPVADYEISEDDFSEPGEKKVKISHTGFGKNGEEKEFTAEVSVTVTENEAGVMEDRLDAVMLDAAAVLDDETTPYRTTEEKQTAALALREALAANFEGYEGELPDTMMEQIGEMEAYFKTAYPDITVRIKGTEELADGAAVIGAVFSADVEQENQVVSLTIEETDMPEGLPEVKAAQAMDICLMAADEEIQPAVPLFLTMNVPEGIREKNLVIYHITESGDIETIVPETADRQMRFGISRLSTFVAANPGTLEVKGIQITSKPVKTVYEIGEEFDSDGMIVTATYENGTEVVVKDYTVTGFDSSSAGVKEVKITYEGHTAILKVTVKAKAADPDDNNHSGGGSSGSSGSGRGPKVNTSSTVTGTWMQDSTGWWFAKTNGDYVKAEWALINGIWYYFGDNGYMQTGWLFYQNQWYFLNPDGSMVDNNWTYDKGRWYFLQSGGAMAADTTTPDGYVVGADGARS